MQPHLKVEAYNITRTMFTNRNLVESLQNGLSFKKNYFNWRKIEISKLTEKENVLLHSMQVDKTLKVVEIKSSY